MADSQRRMLRVLYRGLYRAGKGWVDLNQKAAASGPRETDTILRDLGQRSMLANSTSWTTMSGMREIDLLAHIRETDHVLGHGCEVSGEKGSANWLGLQGLKRAFRAECPQPELQGRIDYGFEVLRHLSFGNRLGQLIFACLQPKKKTAAIKFEIGDILQHREYGWRGVVYGWSELCELDDEWLRKNAAETRRDHPFYNILCNDGTHRYGSQLTHDRVEGPLALLEQLPAVTRARAEAELNRFFLAFDDSEGAYIPNAHLARRFPEPRWKRLMEDGEDFWAGGYESPID